MCRSFVGWPCADLEQTLLQHIGAGELARVGAAGEEDGIKVDREQEAEFEEGRLTDAVLFVQAEAELVGGEVLGCELAADHGVSLI